MYNGKNYIFSGKCPLLSINQQWIIPALQATDYVDLFNMTCRMLELLQHFFYNDLYFIVWGWKILEQNLFCKWLLSHMCDTCLFVHAIFDQLGDSLTREPLTVSRCCPLPRCRSALSSSLMCLHCSNFLTLSCAGQPSSQWRSTSLQGKRIGRSHHLLIINYHCGISYYGNHVIVTI